jgi:uncharacterized protein YqiB (DUF1249 family)
MSKSPISKEGRVNERITDSRQHRTVVDFTTTSGTVEKLQYENERLRRILAQWLAYYDDQGRNRLTMPVGDTRAALSPLSEREGTKK